MGTAAQENTMEFMLVMGVLVSSRGALEGTGLMCANLEIRVAVQWTKHTEINVGHAV